MTYLTFHFVFTIPPIIIMWLLLSRPLAGVGGLRGRYAIPALCVIAFTYTTPWDNFLVANDVWWYGADRVVATIGHVPIEEYMFFILQPILTGLFLYHYLARWDGPQQTDSDQARNIGISLFLFVTLAGGASVISGWDPGFYLGLILVWAGPILTFMWVYAGRSLWNMRRAIYVGAGIPTLYLWVADAIAIHLNIWVISDQYTVGFEPFGLPLEEATFFLVTNLMVVKGILLFLFEDHGALPFEDDGTVVSDRQETAA